MKKLRAAVLLSLAALVSSVLPVSSAAAVSALDLPRVNMEAVILAAQIDPRKPDQSLTPGAKWSVLRVERALDARNLLSPAYVDGHFGTMTIDAYAAFQRSLGYSGLDASGLPGRTSLRILGDGRYNLVRELTPGRRLTYHGHTMNARTKAMLVEAERLLGRTLTVTQGSYTNADPTSAGTHAGGGALDLSVWGMSGTLRTRVVRTLRNVGFAAWLRKPWQGDWPYHIHAIAVSDTDQSPQAQHQAGDYYLGLNGLANRGPDDGPQVPKVTWEDYQRAN